mmetsp:Transcript_37553/g.86731  ORF Transcript_37553/g.86731 Transcript_37553/m.86731 type:complete len:101 (-) Transcript_37553:129-431(-)
MTEGSTFAADASPSKLGDEISVGAASFVRVDDNSRLQAFIQPGARLVVMHDIPGHGGYFMVPDGNLLCGLVQWVLKDGVVEPHYWMEKTEFELWKANQGI